MNVRQLIEVLRGYDPELEVLTSYHSDLVELEAPMMKKVIKHPNLPDTWSEFSVYQWKHSFTQCIYRDEEEHVRLHENPRAPLTDPPSELFEVLYFEGN